MTISATGIVVPVCTKTPLLYLLTQKVAQKFGYVLGIKMIWYKTVEGKLFCRISIPKWEGGIILLNGCELYVRGDAGKKQLKNADLINYVLACYQKKVA